MRVRVEERCGRDGRMKLRHDYEVEVEGSPVETCAGCGKSRLCAN